MAANGSNPGVPAGLRYYHADGLGSTRLLSDETGAVTDKTTFEAFGELDAAASLQSSDNGFLYTGEQLDPNTGFYYLRARYMDPSNGRFTQRDAFAGFDSDPLSLHKYTANHNDPANRVDPTGNISTLVELGASNQVLASLMRTTFTVMNYIDRVNSMVGVIQAFWEISNLLQNPMAFQSASNFLNSSDPGFMSLIQQNFSDAVHKFRRNSGKLFASTIRNYSNDIANTIVGTNQAGQERGFLIFLPTPTAISNAVKM